MAKTQVTAWWLEPGTEICPGCCQLYLYEVEYRCTDCDGPVCSDCVRERESRAVCHACVVCDEQQEEVS